MIMEGTYSRRSRKSTPWDGIDRTPLQEFIRSNYEDAWEQKHRLLSDTNESDLFNSIVPVKCPYCSGEIITRKGMTEGGIQRYLCKQ